MLVLVLSDGETYEPLSCGATIVRLSEDGQRMMEEGYDIEDILEEDHESYTLNPVIVHYPVDL